MELLNIFNVISLRVIFDNDIVLVKVLFVVLEGRKVHIEINTAKKDAFMYNPLWDQPQIQVNILYYEC